MLIRRPLLIGSISRCLRFSADLTVDSIHEAVPLSLRLSVFLGSKIGGKIGKLFRACVIGGNIGRFCWSYRQSSLFSYTTDEPRPAFFPVAC